MKSKINFSGIWVSINDASSVEIAVRKKKGEYLVAVIDSCDGEIAAVSETKYLKSESMLIFAAYWTSTGRFTRYQMRLHSVGKVEITYTHTDSEILILKK